MSFDVNVLSTKPVIKAAASMQNDGGGGNLGYMAHGERDGKEKQNKNTESIFAKKTEIDTFGYEKNWEINKEESFSFQKFFKKLIN